MLIDCSERTTKKKKDANSLRVSVKASLTSIIIIIVGATKIGVKHFLGGKMVFWHNRN